MQFQELSEFIDRTLSDLGKGTFPRDPDMTKRIFAQTIKLSEEVGELSSEVLWKTGFVRKEKLAKHSDETLNDEFADVILVTLRLAKLMGIDIEFALESKMSKIKKRHNGK